MTRFYNIRALLLALILMVALTGAQRSYAQDGDDPTPEPTQEPGDEGGPVEEAPAEEEPAPTQEVGISLDSVIALLVFLLGFFPILGGSIGAVVSTIVDIIKSTKLLKDGWAALPLLLLNFLAIVVLYVVYNLKPGEAIPADLDTTLRQLTELIAAVLTFAGSLGFGRLFHEKVLKPLSPRFSYSAQDPKAAPSHRPI